MAKAGATAEVKSMRTAPRRAWPQGRRPAHFSTRVIAKRAGAWGLARVSLETGTTADFFDRRRPGCTSRAGFTDCAAFGDYPPSAYNRFMTLALDADMTPTL